jgi:hypothetical protein
VTAGLFAGCTASQRIQAMGEEGAAALALQVQVTSVVIAHASVAVAAAIGPLCDTAQKN